MTSKKSIMGQDMNSHNKCDSRNTAYKNGKTFEQCKQEALMNSNMLSIELKDGSEITWNRVLGLANHDELVYKLTLKYLRQKGFDIGNNTTPRISQMKPVRC